MRDLYDRLIVEGEAGIERLIQERAQEGLQLDFKLKGRASHGAFEDTDRRTLAKAVSGFANSAGGLIVWGVNAEKVDGVDCAQPPTAPISNIEQFASEAASLVGQLIQPKHDGVHISIVPSVSSSNSGFLLVYVERSERRPHRSEAKGQKQYFKRAGDSFFEMEHYDIEDAFSRTAAASLDLSWTDSSIGIGDTQHHGRPVFGLANNSSTSAKFPYISISKLNGISFDRSDLQLNQSFKLHQEYGTFHFVGSSDAIIHPEMHLSVFTLRIFFNRKPEIGWVIGWRSIDEFSPSLEYVYGCDGSQAKRGCLVFPATRFSLPS